MIQNNDNARMPAGGSVQPASVTPSEDFIRSFTTVQRALYLYILPLVGNAADADEILQETNVVIWAKWKQFEPGTNFLAWGRAIARLEVFRHRRNRNHHMNLMDESLLDRIAQKAEVISDEADARLEALSHCLGQLRPKDLELVQLRYTADSSGDDVAESLGRPANSVYQSLGRIRRTLLECVRLRLIDQGGLS